MIEDDDDTEMLPGPDDDVYEYLRRIFLFL